MKKKKTIIVGILIALIIILGVKMLTQPTQKERQIAFLKEHEEEMVTFIKKYSSEDEDITFHWDTTESGPVMPFGEKVMTIRFNISNSSDPDYNNRGYNLRIKANLIKLKKIDELLVLNDPIYENIEEDLNE